MTTTAFVSFHGASDDLIYCVADPGIELADDGEHPLDEASSLHHGGWLIRPPASPMFRVIAHYVGTWSFSIAHHDEDEPFEPPADFCATVEQSPECAYSTRLELQLPVGTVVRLDERDAHRP